jgi:hypothetical protein
MLSGHLAGQLLKSEWVYACSLHLYCLRNSVVYKIWKRGVPMLQERAPAGLFPGTYSVGTAGPYRLQWVLLLKLEGDRAFEA